MLGSVGIKKTKLKKKLKKSAQSATFTIRLAHTLTENGAAKEKRRVQNDAAKANTQADIEREKALEDSVREKADSGITEEQWIQNTPKLGASDDINQDRATQMLALWGLPSSTEEAKRFCTMMQKIGQQDAANSFASERRNMLEKYKGALADAQERGSFEETEIILQSISKMTGKNSNELSQDVSKLKKLYPKPKPAKDIATALGLPYDLKDYKLDPTSIKNKTFQKTMRRHVSLFFSFPNCT